MGRKVIVEEKQVYVLIDSFWAGAFEFDVRDWFLSKLAEYNVRFFVSSSERAIDSIGTNLAKAN